MADPLKLRAEDEEDLSVISAILQDALVAVGEMAWLPEERRFVLVANRLRREAARAGARRELERRMAGLRFDGVKSVQRRGFTPRDGERLLVLLAIQAGPGALYLEFAGGSSIRLEVERILCHLDDLGEPWPTRWQPRHPVEDAG
jgi:predicted TIM-barrel fold metal-dependent hydrolase